MEVQGSSANVYCFRLLYLFFAFQRSHDNLKISQKYFLIREQTTELEATSTELLLIFCMNLSHMVS